MMSIELGVETLQLTRHDQPHHQTSPPRRHHGTCVPGIGQFVQLALTAQINA